MKNMNIVELVKIMRSLEKTNNLFKVVMNDGLKEYIKNIE